MVWAKDLHGVGPETIGSFGFWKIEKGGGISIPKPKRLRYGMGVSKNNGIPKSSILMGFSIINHPFWGTTIFGNTRIFTYIYIPYIQLLGSPTTIHVVGCPSQGLVIGSMGYFSYLPIGSMYGIYTYIWLIFMVNVAKYTIHGYDGYWS